MRFSFLTTVTVALAADGAIASSWFSRAAYNKWHETELERWLSDHNIPYPTPADRKDLQNLVKDHWNDKVVSPYNSWDVSQLQNYIKAKSADTQQAIADDKDTLLTSVKSSWYETEDQASDAYNSVRDWIFDTWTESQLKAFCDRHGIPVPQPRERDSLLKTVRESYQTVANKLGETFSYPGDWLYESWSDSDLKAWLDERGYPAPQPSSRDNLIASLRRHSRQATLNAQSLAASASASAAAATQSLSDALLNSWSDSQIKEWCDKNGIKVPQGPKRNELLALARKHRAKLTGDNVADKASSYYGAATSNAGNQYAQATQAGNNAYSVVVSYIDWFKYNIGLLDAEAKARYSSAIEAAKQSASSLSSVASKSSNSASSAASKAASKSGQKAADAVKESASAAKHRAEEAAQKVADNIREDL